MKIIKSSVEILPQKSGVEGMYKLIERVARCSYKSEDKISEDSYKKFNDMIYNRGHWAVFNLGTVYLKVPNRDHCPELLTLISRPYNAWTKWEEKDEMFYVTTNYRVICQAGLQEFMEKYWCEPTEYHYHRVTTHWICSRSIGNELVRHRAMNFIQESTRYINYHRGKFNSELTYILPQWIYRVRDEIANTIDSLTGESREYIKDLDGQELWDTLCCYDRTVASRDRLWEAAEEEYMYEVTTDEGEKLKAEEARDSLPLGLKTEICMTGFVEDFYYVPKPDTKEKAGFFFLRSANDAHPDIKVLSDSLMKQFEEKGIDKLK